MKKQPKISKLFACIVFGLAVLAMIGKAEVAEADAPHYLEPYQYGRESTSYTGDPTKSFSMMGAKYYYGIAANGLYVDRDFYFKLDRKFTKVTFDLGNVDCKGELRGNPGTARIYLDGYLAQEIPVSSGMITQKVSVDTEGIKQMIVDFHCPGNTNNDAYYGLGNVIGHGGHLFTIENTIPATPKSEGLRTYFCDACGYSYEETVAPIDKCVPYLHPYSVTDNIDVFKGGTETFTAMGTKYNYGVSPDHWYGDRTVLYNLGQMYNSVTFDIGWTGAGTGYDSSSTMYIYADNNLVKTLELTARMCDETITLRTPGITQLKFVFGANGQYGIFNMSYDAKELEAHSLTSQVTLEPTTSMSGIKSVQCEKCGLSYTETIPKIKKYTATFKANGGTKLSKSKITVASGKKLGTLPTVVRKGYTFKGWYTKTSGGIKITASTKLKANKTYYAQWTKVTKPNKVTNVKLTNPQSKKMKVTYNKVTNAKGYQIVYSTNKNFNNSKKTITTGKQITIKNLSKGKTYYVKVRAYKLDSMKNKVYGNYSAVVKVKIKK